MRYAVLLLAGLALLVAWTAFSRDGPDRPGVPAIELSPREGDGGQQSRRGDARRSERQEARGSPADPGEGAAPAPAPPPAPAGDDDDVAEGDDEESDERDDGDDGDD